MGSYASVSGHRSVVQQIPQMVYSAIKVPLLIGVTVLLSTPIFYVINALSGLASDFRSALHAIVSAQAGLTIILSSLMPITLFMYLSVSHHPVGYQLAILFNAAMFGLASITAQRLLWSYYRPLIRADDRHAVMVQMWIFVYAFVGIQAAYVLRPFIGSPNMKTTFIREESFENAYVRIIELVADVWKQMF